MKNGRSSSKSSVLTPSPKAEVNPYATNITRTKTMADFVSSGLMQLFHALSLPINSSLKDPAE